jgi:hypothetical protein
MGRTRALLAALVALALVPATQAHASVTFGVSVNRVINDDFTPSHWDAPLSAVRSSAIRVARTDAPWGWAEPRPPYSNKHTFDWTRHDKIALALAQHGMQWLPVLAYSAPWAATDTTDSLTPPKRNADYAAYAGALAKRYGRGGSFWAEHPEVGARPVTAYEIWNEPNGFWFWRPKADAKKYGDMYLKARTAIRKADPAGKAIVGGITNDLPFVRDMFRDNPALDGKVDGVGWHPYGANASEVLNEIRRARGELLGLAHPDIPIYVTELGWPTQGKNYSYVLEEPARGRALEKAADTLARSDCGVAMIVTYTWSTPELDPNSVEDWYGLNRADGTPTPSMTAYSRVLERWQDKPVPQSSRVHLCGGLYPSGESEQRDTDGDGLPDGVETDDDNDGVPDRADALPRNPDETVDTDLDGKGDNADKDDDNDGLSDRLERRIHTYRTDVDTDDDGLRDRAERDIGTDPRRADTDRDGLPDGMERGVAKPAADPRGAARGTNLKRFRPDRDPRTRTRPRRRDTDGDGLADRREDRNGNGRRDAGESDPRLADTDGDGVKDGADRRPLNPRH